MRKQAIELQFHWIFMLIAGAVILAFFFSVVYKQQELSEQRLSITLAAQMDAIYTGAIESKGTAQRLVTPRPGIAFACSEVCECNYFIGTKATEFSDKLLFAPAFIKGQDAVAWALEWKLPFRIANLLMLTNPTIKYYLVYEAGDPNSEQVFKRFSKALPSEINQEILRSPDAVYGLTPQGYAHTRLVFLGTARKPDLRNLHLDFRAEDVSGIWIGQDLRQVVFFEKTDPEELVFNEYPSLLAGDATTYAAMFAADHQLYDCVMKRAFEKMRIVALVQAERARALQNAMSISQQFQCSYVLQDLDAVAQAAGQIAAAPVFRGQESALATIRGAESELKRQNDNLILQSCPELF
jgi:hypothetical protein